MDYQFNVWRVEGKPVENAWTKEEMTLLSGGTERPVLTDADLSYILYLYYIKGLSCKEILKKISSVGYVSTIKCIVEGRYTSSVALYHQFMDLKENNPEKLEKLFAIKTYKV